MDGKRICFFMHWFSGGGAEKMTIVLVNALCRRGYPIRFYVRHDMGLMRQTLDPGIEVVDMRLPAEGKLYKNIKNIEILRKVLTDPENGILFCITAEMSQVAALASASLFGRKTVPLVSVVHNTLSMETHSFQLIRQVLFPAFNRRYDKVVAISREVALDYEKVCRAPDGQIKIIGNPIISEDIFRRSRQESGHPWLAEGRGWKTLVLAGRLSYQKNHELMFQALKILRSKEDFRLLILGVGEREEELKKLCGRLELENAVSFEGYQTNPYPYFRESDAVILCSRYEGLPTVLVEAMACGSRIVSVDCPSGPKELLENGRYGFLTPMGSPEKLADGILESMKWNPDKDALKAKAMDFTVEASADGYESLLKDMMKEER